jgi:prepilin-type processing-associated H-X9-DG protein
LARSAQVAANANELAAIEQALINLWGDRFLSAPIVLDVQDFELNVHFRAGGDGFINEVVDFDQSGENPPDSVKRAQTNAKNASCMNNMKQLGLAMRMFENEQAVNLRPAGWRMIYPEYLADTKVLTCPGAEPGTESYELIYPGAGAEWMNALARQLEGLPEDTPTSTSAALIPIAVEKHHCSGTDGRHVAYLDGHVERLGDADWDAYVAPYLEYR